MKKEIKIIKNNMKKNQDLRIYKDTIQNSRFQFIFSKVFLIFNETDLNQLTNIETNLVKNLNEGFFEETFKKIKLKANWAAFGKFMFLIYKTSSYKYDLKDKKENIFIKEPIKGNQTKRNHYDEWLDSLDFSKDITNTNVRRVLKLVFSER